MSTLQVFVVVRQDPRSDDEITVHLTRSSAHDAMDQFIQQHADRTFEEDPLPRGGWIRYAESPPEGPSVRIEMMNVIP